MTAPTADRIDELTLLPCERPRNVLGQRIPLAQNRVTDEAETVDYVGLADAITADPQVIVEQPGTIW
jgi:hypothetical protein